MATAVQVESILGGLTDNSGQPLAAGKVYTYYAGSTTPVSLFTSSDKSTLATNPLVLDGHGKAQVWADGRYKFVVKDQYDVTQYTLDNLLYGFDDTILLWGGQSTGSANMHTVSVPATVTAYANGQSVSFIAGYSNTGATTLQFNALGAVSIVKGPDAVSLQDGDLVAGCLYTATYEAYSGTGRFRLGEYPTLADTQRSRFELATNVSGINAITAVLTPAISAYDTGLVFRFKAVSTNTGAVTVNINGLGAKDVKRFGVALVGGEIKGDAIIEVVYDGTQFQLLSPVEVATPLWGGVTEGTATAYTITLAPALTAYTTGLRISFKAHLANGAAPTLSVNGLVAKSVRRQGTALVGNEFIANDLIEVQYDGTDFQVLNVVTAPLYVDRTNNRVGIGTTLPQSDIDLQTANGTVVTTAFSTTGGSSVSLRRSKSATVGTNTLLANGDGIGTIFFQGANGTGYTSVAAINAFVDGTPGATNDMPGRLGFYTTPDGSGTLLERMTIKADGKIGFGVTPVGKAHVFSGLDDDTIYVETSGNRPTVRYLRSGTSYATTFVDGGGFTTGSNNSYACRAGSTGGMYLAPGGISWTAISDQRFKKNIKPLEYGLNQVLAMNPVRFDYLEDAGDSSARIGFVAQEMQPIIPEAIQGSEELRLGLSPTELIPALVNAIKQLSAKVEALEVRVAAPKEA